jgi:hypothetical protein
LSPVLDAAVRSDKLKFVGHLSAKRLRRGGKTGKREAYCGIFRGSSANRQFNLA